MFSWDKMVLSKISNFDSVIEEDCPFGAFVGLDFGMVSRTFSFSFPMFFP